MKTLLATLLIIAGVVSSGTCRAQMGTGMGTGMGPGADSGDMSRKGNATLPGEGRRGPACDKTPEPAKCEANRKAREQNRAKANEQCKDSAGADRRKCVREIMMSQENCATANNPKRCETMKQAYEPCKEKTGPELRQCMRDAAPKPDCGMAADKVHCEAMGKAREACKGKSEADFRTCMREQLPPRKATNFTPTLADKP